MKPFFLNRWTLLGIFTALSFIVYGRSLNYDFVYDDLWRIKENPALVESIHNPLDFFRDPDIQSTEPAMNKQTYRPLMALNFAFERALWGKDPAPFRFINLLFHGWNGFLVMVLAAEILGLSLLAAFAAGCLFLIHPVQVETAVWVVERSNILSLFFILLTILCWNEFRKGGRVKYLISSYGCFICGLLFRETAVCIPVLVFFIDYYHSRFRNSKLNSPPNTAPQSLLWPQYLGFASVVGAYLILRFSVLGVFKQTAFWGGGFLTNTLTVFAAFPTYLSTIVFPSVLSPNYSLPVAQKLTDIRFLSGLFLFIACSGVIIYCRTIAWRVSLVFLLFIISWIPASGLIPLQTIFADRFLYPMMVFAGCGVGLTIEWLALRVKTSALRFVLLGILSIWTLGLLWKTETYIPAWKTELSLWSHAVQVDPHDYFAWFCLGLEQQQKAEKAGSKTDSAKLALAAEASYKNALKGRMKPDFAGEVFLKIAKMNLLSGDVKAAAEHAQRGIILRPDLKGDWEVSMRELKLLHSH